MVQQNSFWRKYDKIIVALATLLFIYLLVFFSQKVNFWLGNEMIVHLTPEQKSFEMHYGDIRIADFDVSMDNAAYCRAECNYSFNDRSRNEIVEQGSFEIKEGEHFKKSYELGVKRLGSGQDIYSFDVSCRSMRSLLCLTTSPEKSRLSLITVNYDLTETEKELKNELKQNVAELLNGLNNVDIMRQQASQKYFELALKINLNNLSKIKISIDDIYGRSRAPIENLRSLWAAEDYIKLNKSFDESYFASLESLKALITGLNNSIESIAGLHNRLLLQLSLLSNSIKELEVLTNMLGDDEISESFAAAAGNLNKIASALTNNAFGNYKEAAESIDNTTKQENMLIVDTKTKAAGLFLKSEYYLKFENDLLCSLSLSCKENISVTNAIKNTEEFFDKHPNSTLLKNSCNSLKELEQKYSRIRNYTSAIIENKSISFPSEIGFFELANDFKDNEIRKLNNSYIDSFEKTVQENKTNAEVLKIALAILPKNKTDIISLDYNQSINLSLYLLSKINLSDATISLLNTCSKLDKPAQIREFDFKPISTNLSYGIVSKINTTLSDNPPICCVFNECRPCCNDDLCRNDPKAFPIIFLHGHSFSKDNSPEYSLDAFNKIQSRLQQDGYLNVGIISLYTKNEPMQDGIWGMSHNPVTVRASYYYDTFRKDDKYIVIPTKSESIDTYALRLKDLVDIVKERTNKPKVNIIAHSMGGLVARRYMQIFGDEDIDKLVMIATPNKGISGVISDYCGLIGENRECQDMQENSLFINKLNDPSKQPLKAKLYSIIGQGCKMKFADGDGIVLSENAELENAKMYFINGTCTGLFGGRLHTGILNIEKYPETYKIITEILME